MSTFDPIIEGLKGNFSYTEKSQIMSVLLNMLQTEKPTAKDVTSLSDFAFGEIESMFAWIEKAETYKEKIILFEYEDKLLGLVMKLYPAVHAVPADKMERIRELIQLVNKERYLETALDKLFESDPIEDRDVEILVHIASTVKDECQRGQLYVGLLNYQNKFPLLSDAAKQTISAYIASEMERYLDRKDGMDEDTANNLEVACDVCKHFMSDRIVELLHEILKLAQNHINYYAVATLLENRQTIPPTVIDALARDLEYADMTYDLLAAHRMTNLFPAELSNREYLAKSDMVHWLMYPTELGKQPDQIEYLGSVKVKREPYYVFRFRSDSDTLGDDLKNKWLIGWSSKDGGTFSQFDEYALYEQKTPEKTLKYIKKKLIG